MFDDYFQLLGVIIRQIQGLGNQSQIQLLFKRYIEGKKLRDITKEMGDSYVYVKELHKKSLQNFESSYQILPNPTFWCAIMVLWKNVRW